MKKLTLNEQPVRRIKNNLNILFSPSIRFFKLIRWRKISFNNDNDSYDDDDNGDDVNDGNDDDDDDADDDADDDRRFEKYDDEWFFFHYGAQWSEDEHFEQSQVAPMDYKIVMRAYL